jgi:hypothetical protein
VCRLGKHWWLYSLSGLLVDLANEGYWQEAGREKGSTYLELLRLQIPCAAPPQWSWLSLGILARSRFPPSGTGFGSLVNTNFSPCSSSTRWQHLLAAGDLIRLSNVLFGQAPVAHTCNPSYSGDRDQKDRGSKAAQVNSS